VWHKDYWESDMSRSAAARHGLSLRRAICIFAWVTLSLIWPAACWAARVITRIDVRPVPRGTSIALSTADKGALEPKSFSLDDPPRLVFDFADAALDSSLPAEVSAVAPCVERIRLGQFSADPLIARLVVDLSGDALAPIVKVEAGKEPGETVIVVRESGAAVLGAPSTAIVEGVSIVRLPGAGQLRRSVANLADPPRVYADLTDAVIEEACRQELPRGVIREIRMGQQPADADHPVARIVLELREQQAHVVFADGSDLVLAVGPNAWALPLPDYQANNRLKGKRIVLDPGHGGDDIGAPAVFGRSPKGPFEKDIVLDMALRLAKLVAAEGATVKMTRERDVGVGLRDRAEVANRMKAHALVSIHCDSCDAPNTLNGTSVYYDHQHSRGFAGLVQGELIAALGTADRGVRNANFAVIRRTRGPGVLVEVAYMNHEGDRARLVHPNFRERAARAMLQGLIRFLSDDAK